MSDHTSACDGRPIPPWLAAFHDHQQRAHLPHRYLLSLDTRIRLHRAKAAERSEDRLVKAILLVANRLGEVEHAAHVQGELRAEDEDEAAARRLIRGHHFDPARVTALRGLARSRGCSLEVVLRAALRGTLRQVVELPPVSERTADDAAD